MHHTKCDVWREGGSEEGRKGGREGGRADLTGCSHRGAIVRGAEKRRRLLERDIITI